MTSAWRWPLAGFVLGALVGATILTVNVVGASSPERPPAAAGILRGGPAHAAVLVPAGQPVELALRRGLRCRADEPDDRVLAEGVGLRPSARAADFEEVPLARDPSGRLSARFRVGTRRGAGFDYYAEIDHGGGESATVPAGSGRGTAARLAASGAGRRSTSGRTGSARPGPGSSILAGYAWGKGDACPRARQRPRAIADRPVCLRHRSRRRRRRARPGQRGCSSSCATASRSELPIAFAGGEGDLAVAGDGTIYVLEAVA